MLTLLFITETTPPTAPALVDTHLHVIHGRRVMFDSDRAILYGATTKALKQAVKRNADRFPRAAMIFRAIKDLMAQSAAPGAGEAGIIGFHGRPKKGHAT